MQLTHALRVDLPTSRPPRLAFVGAGGKSTAMFRLARELLSGPHYPAVIVSASTHLFLRQAQAGDRHWVWKADPLPARLPPGLTVVTGPPGVDERTQGLLFESLETLAERARAWGAPLLIEADGARRLPIKAPAEHEPALPGWVDTVVVVAGVWALGQPLGAGWVHRPEIFAALSGLAQGDLLDWPALGRVLTHSQGGLKNIRPGMRRVALLTVADSLDRPLQLGQAQRLAGSLLPAFHAALIAAFEEDDRFAPDPVVAVHEPVAGVLLAAGGSTRLGRPKQLLEWEGETFVRRAARTALAGGVSPLVVVTGAYSDEVAAALAGLPLKIVFNPQWETGQGSSVALGTRALPPETGAAFFLLVDQPLVSPPLLHSLVDLHRRSLAPIVAPLVDEQRANPVLFDRVTFPELAALSGEAGGRVLFSKFRAAWLPWHDRGPLFDVDTDRDYARLLGERNGPEI